MYQVELVFNTLQHLVTLYITVYFIINKYKLLFSFPGTLTFQQCGYFKYLRLDFSQHFILTDKVYHQIGHFLTLMLQIVFQLFFLQLHNLLFLASLLLFIFPFHIMQFLVLLDHSLLLFPLHADIIPAIDMPQGKQSQDDIIPYRKKRKGIVKTNGIHGISYHRNRLLS